jgi:hypothetical protein
MYFERLESHQRQWAGFGQIDFNLSRRLKLTAGLRVARDTFDFVDDVDGPANGGSSRGTGNQADTPVTPKFVLSFTSKGGSLFYASAAAGYRGGGANSVVGGLQCAEPLRSSASPGPPCFNSDRVWSYEAGAKSTSPKGGCKRMPACSTSTGRAFSRTYSCSAGSASLQSGKAHTQERTSSAARVTRGLPVSARWDTSGKFDAPIPGFVQRGDLFAVWL